MNKSIYELNIDAVNKAYSGNYLYDIINSDSRAEDVVLEISAEGNCALKLKRDGKEMYINSKYSPQKEAQRFAENIRDYDVNTMFIVFGMGPAYHIRELNKLLTKTNRIIVIEPSIDVFKKSLEGSLLVDIIENKNIYLSVGSDLGRIKSVYSTLINAGNVSNFQVLVFSKYDRLYEDFYLECIKELKDYVISTQILINTINHFSYEFNRNLFHNLVNIVKGYAIQEFKGKFTGVPAVIVSAGPSLDKNIRDLTEGIGKCIIFSGGRTVQALQENGIDPDFIVSIDPGIAAFNIVENRLDTDIPLITSIISNDKVVEKHKGKKFFIGNSEHTELIKYFKNAELEVLPQGGSVAHTCLACASYFGCDPIIFIGQDLAYTGGKYHADNSKDMEEVNRDHKGEIEVEGIYGEKVFTSQVWLAFLRWIEVYIFSFREKHFVNATEGGVNIKGTEVLTLKDALSKYCSEDRDIKGRISRILNESHDVKIALEECLEKLKKMKNDLEEVKKHAKTGITLCDKMLEYYENNRNIDIGKILSRLDKVDKSILRYKVNNTAVNDLISPTLLQVQLNKEFNEKFNETEREKGIRLAKKSKALYMAIRGAIEAVPELVDDSIREFEDNIMRGAL